MTDKQTGGPAFPALPIQRHLDTGEILYQAEGITIRDYFAAKAMQGLLAGNPSTTSQLIEATKGSGSVSELAYVLADAMLKAREA